MTDLSVLRTITSADVYKGGVLAGVLRRSEQGSTEFVYRPEYVRSAGDPVASTLPLRFEPFQGFGGAVPSFFSGLLPEGHRLTVLQRAVKTSLADEMTLLLAVGADVPGDVQIVAAGSALGDVPPLVQGPRVSDVDFTEIVDGIDRQGLPGVQNKASASMISSPLAAEFGRYILKLSQQGYPHLIENEEYHLRAASAMRVPVAEAALVRDRNTVPGLLVRRFDRYLADGQWRRLAFEDGTQVLDLPPSAKYSVDAVAVVRALADRADAPLAAIRNMFLQFVFAWLTGNGDLHAKNIGLLRDPSGRWAVAPIYDIPSTLFYGDDTMALPVVGRSGRLRIRDWLAFGAELGLPDRAVVSACKTALNAASAMNYGDLPFIGSPRNRVERELRIRRSEVADL